MTTHEAAQELLAAEALHALGPDDRARLLEHARTCPECLHALAEYRDAAALLAGCVPSRPMDRERSERVRARLLARASADRGGSVGTDVADPAIVPGVPIPPRRSEAQGRWAGWAVAAGLASLLLTHHAFHRPLVWGWIAAALLGLLVVAMGAYAVIQRDRVAALERELKERGGSSADSLRPGSEP